ncbi:MAG: HU family DNA-binding protein [Acidimicrobiales bacterium]|jgi:DNA-binding protein HU-beta
MAFRVHRQYGDVVDPAAACAAPRRAESCATRRFLAGILARDLARLRAPSGALSRKCLLLSRKPSLISEIAFPGGGAVNKSGLIDAVTKTTSLAKRDAEEAVNALVHVVSKEVRSGRRVVVAGFGSFNPTHRGPRMGRNPRTGAPVSISASRGVRFAASGMLKDILNGKAAPPALKLSSPPAKKSSKAPVKKATAKKAAAKATKRVATKVTKNSTPKAVKKTAGGASKKVVGRAPVRKTTRAPARKAAKQSARKAAGRAPARKAIKRSAKKAVRRA